MTASPPETHSADACLSRLLDRVVGHAAHLGGSFGTALRAEVHRFDKTFALDAGAGVLLNWFFDLPEARSEALFQILKRACTKAGRLRDEEVDALAALMIVAAMRCLDTSRFAKSLVWQGGPGHRHAAVNRLETSSSLLAAVAMAGLNGLALRVTPHALPDGVYDLTGVALQTDVGPSVLRALYGMAFPRKQRPDPLAALDGMEIGELRAHFDDRRYDEIVTAVYIRFPSYFDAGMQQQLLQDVATAIDSVVIAGSERNEQGLTRWATTNVTPESLLAKLNDILRSVHGGGLDTRDRTQGLVAPAPSPAPTTPASTPAATTFDFDVFVSHASDDTVSFVDTLVQNLRGEGLRVWYDHDEIVIGDSFTDKINDGLARSRYIVLVCSAHFIDKGWTNAELRAALTLQINQRRKRILPLLYGVTYDLVSERYPLLADRSFASTAEGPIAVASRIRDAVRKPEARE